MEYKLSEIIKILNIKNIDNINKDSIITGISIDSRKVKKGDLFIPFSGENTDGHKYIDIAIQNGAVASLATKKNISNNKNILYVDDVLISLQKIAKNYLDKIKPKIIAITGSNGKTTTKDIIFELIKDKYISFKTQGNYNNEIGVPLTILSAKKNTEVLVLEMGADGFSQLEKLSELTNPDFTVITNIGESHIQYFGNRLGIAKGKFEINKYLKKEGYFIYNGDEPLLNEIINNNKQNINIISCGENANNNITIKEFKQTNQNIEFYVSNIKNKIISNLLGKHNSLNICYSIAIAKKLKIEDSEIILKLKKLNELTSMRLEKLKYNKDSLIINDAYNASPTSMIAGINILEEIKDYNHKTLILGDMFELGDDEIKYHEKIGNHIEKNIKTIDIVITVGNLAKNITNKITKIKTIHFNTNEEVIKYLNNTQHNKEIILFKASRGMKLEQIINNMRGLNE